MELHQLRYFVEVVQSGSFTKAAERCNVTQPTLSHQIKKLEDALGEPLLQRRRQGVRTTPMGESFRARGGRGVHRRPSRQPARRDHPHDRPLRDASIA